MSTITLEEAQARLAELAFQDVLERSDRRLKEEGGISPEEVRQKLGHR